MSDVNLFAVPTDTATANFVGKAAYVQEDLVRYVSPSASTPPGFVNRLPDQLYAYSVVDTSRSISVDPSPAIGGNRMHTNEDITVTAPKPVAGINDNGGGGAAGSPGGHGGGGGGAIGGSSGGGHGEERSGNWFNEAYDWVKQNIFGNNTQHETTTTVMASALPDIVKACMDAGGRAQVFAHDHGFNVGFRMIDGDTHNGTVVFECRRD